MKSSIYSYTTYIKQSIDLYIFLSDYIEYYDSIEQCQTDNTYMSLSKIQSIM
jgi:uncharacterized short protein YbdD (DUF466 family)